MIDELKRRDVIRVGVAYLAVSWLLLQVVDTISPILQLPPAVPRYILLVLVIGLPIALILAWMFQITPDGVRHEDDPDQQPTDIARPGPKLNYLIIGALLLAVLVLVIDRANIGISSDPAAVTEQENTGERSTLPGVARGPKVAVLPFRNLSDDVGDGYFSDGLSEDISTALSRFTSVRVIPASLTVSFRDSSDLRAAGTELDAAYVIGGSVRLADGDVRIGVRLIDVATSTQLWGETYDRELSTANLFDIQSEVAQHVVSAIAEPSGVLSRVGQSQLRSPPTDSVEAYRCVLRGYAYQTIHTVETHLLAKECLEKAVQLDPGYADAWAHLGYIYREEVQHNRNLEPNALDRAMTAAQTAIELDGANPMARFAMSMIQFSLGNSNAGMAEAEKAVALNPNDATKMLAVAVYAVNAGEIERGVELARTAEAIIPTLPRWFPMIYTSAHYQAGEYDEALTEFSKWDEEGNDVQWHFNRVAILGQLGRISEASAELERTYELFPGFAADPVGELRKFLLTDATVEKYYDGLMKAGLEDEFPD